MANFRKMKLGDFVFEDLAKTKIFDIIVIEKRKIESIKIL